AADAYSVGISVGGGVIAVQNIAVTVEPVVTGLAVSGYVFADGGGNYHAYSIDGVFGIPGGQRLTVTAATMPAAVGAWPIPGGPRPAGPARASRRRQCERETDSARRCAAGVERPGILRAYAAATGDGRRARGAELGGQRHRHPGERQPDHVRRRPQRRAGQS